MPPKEYPCFPAPSSGGSVSVANSNVFGSVDNSSKPGMSRKPDNASVKAISSPSRPSKKAATVINRKSPVRRTGHSFLDAAKVGMGGMVTTTTTQHTAGTNTDTEPTPVAASNNTPNESIPFLGGVSNFESETTSLDKPLANMLDNDDIIDEEGGLGLDEDGGDEDGGDFVTEQGAKEDNYMSIADIIANASSGDAALDLCLENLEKETLLQNNLFGNQFHYLSNHDNLVPGIMGDEYALDFATQTHPLNHPGDGQKNENAKVEGAPEDIDIDAAILDLGGLGEAISTLNDGGNTSYDHNLNGCIFAGKRFAKYAQLYDAIEAVMHLTGMEPSDLGRKSKDTFSAKESVELFGSKTFNVGNKTYKFPKRGHFKCNRKNDHGEACPFYIPFTNIIDTNSASRFYEIKSCSDARPPALPTPLCLQHNHDTIEVGISGRKYISKLANMSKEEIDVCETLSLTYAKMSAIQEAMSIKFPDKIFDSDLLHRVIKQERDNRIGPDRHRIPELLAMGDAAQANGGVWAYKICPETFKLQSTFYQTATQKEFALQYGSYYASGDGTFGTNKYGLTLFPWLAPDCLGLSQNLGTATSRSENSVDVSQSAELFSLSSRQTDLSVMVEYNMHQVAI